MMAMNGESMERVPQLVYDDEDIVENPSEDEEDEEFGDEDWDEEELPELDEKDMNVEG